MSYRSIKRVLGETSLERKCRLLFGACLLLLITGSFWWYGGQIEQIVNEKYQSTGRWLVDQDMLVRHTLVAAENEKYQDLTQQISESFSKQKCKERFILPNLPAAKDGGPDGFNPEDKFELDITQRFLKEEPRKTGASEDDQFAWRMSDGREQVLLLSADSRHQ